MSKGLLIDDEIFFRQPFGGVSKIFAILIDALQKSSNYTLQFYNLYTENEYLLALKLNSLSPFLKNKNFPLKGKIIRVACGFISHAKVNKAIKSNNPLVFHPTFYSNYYLNELKAASNVKLVFTVHDLIHEKFGSTNHYKQIANYKEQNLKVADAIIAVSENSKNDILLHYPFVEPNKIVVNYLAQSLSSQQELPINNLPEDYILFVGERSGYKNFTILVQAFAKIAIKHPNLKVFCTGSKPFSAQEMQVFKQLNIADKFIQTQLNLGQLKTAYLNAKLFVFPSLYEGFGIPILEAFACKTPVVVSNCGSLPEVAGNAALLFDPNNADDLSEKIETLLEDNLLAKELVEKGILREKQFSWQKHIETTLNIYNKL